LSLEVIGDKWSLLILRDLIAGKKRYQEFLGSREGISTNILADRLAKLEKRGIISKSDDPESKKQFIYAPTEKGLDLMPILVELARWGIKHDPNTDRSKPIVKEIQKMKDPWSARRQVVFSMFARVRQAMAPQR
jgi:DNA-binding HxlR family transcriptional regulator